MTFKRREYGNGHSYTLNGEKLPGVTTVIGILDKPALVNWAAEQSANYAIEHWDELADKPIMERAKLIKDARWATNRAAVTKGHRVHDMGERVSRGEDVHPPEEYRAAVEAYAQFCDKWEIETVATEAPCCNTSYRYAGTLDAIIRSPKLGQVMLDIKTTKAVYSEVALQLAAYRYCDLMINNGAEQAMIQTDAAYVAHVRDDTVDLVPIAQSDKITETFLHLLDAFYESVKPTDWKNRDDPGALCVVGDPIYPDQLQPAS